MPKVRDWSFNFVLRAPQCPQPAIQLIIAGPVLNPAGQTSTPPEPGYGTKILEWWESPRMRWRVMGRAYWGWLFAGILRCVGVCALLGTWGALRSDALFHKAILVPISFGVVYRLLLELRGRWLTLSRPRPTRVRTRYSNALNPAPPARLCNPAIPNSGDWGPEQIEVIPCPITGPVALLRIECTTPAKRTGRTPRNVIFAAPATLAQQINLMLEREDSNNSPASFPTSSR